VRWRNARAERQDSIQGHAWPPLLPGSLDRRRRRAQGRQDRRLAYIPPAARILYTAGALQKLSLSPLSCQDAGGRRLRPRRRAATAAAAPRRRRRASLPATLLHEAINAVVRGRQAPAFPPYLSMKPLWKAFRRAMTSSVSFSCTRMVVRKWYVPSSCARRHRPSQSAYDLRHSAHPGNCFKHKGTADASTQECMQPKSFIRSTQYAGRKFILSGSKRRAAVTDTAAGYRASRRIDQPAAPDTAHEEKRSGCTTRLLISFAAPWARPPPHGRTRQPWMHARGWAAGGGRRAPA